MENDTEKREDKNLRDLTPEKDAKGGDMWQDPARRRKPSLSGTVPTSGGPVPPIPAPIAEQDSTN